jgi:hypothetical protein
MANIMHFPQATFSPLVLVFTVSNLAAMSLVELVPTERRTYA